jgi:hypothetical protein
LLHEIRCLISLIGGLFAANIPHYLYPLLNIMNKEKPYEHLRLTSLGVIGALVKVINFSFALIVLYILSVGCPSIYI